MSIWSSINEPALVTAGSGTPGAEPLEVDVAVAPGFSNRTRVAAWNDEESYEFTLTPDDARHLAQKLLEGAERAEKPLTPAADVAGSVITEQENAACAEASN